MSRSYLPRAIREGLNKALGYLQFEQLDKALDCMIATLKELSGYPMNALKEARPAIQGFLEAFEKHPRVRILLEQKDEVFASIPYRLGIEARLAVVLEGLAKILREQAELSAKAKVFAEQRKREQFLLQTGLQHLEKGQILLAKAFFQRLLTEFPNEQELLLTCAKHLEQAGFLSEAVDFYTKILKTHPTFAEASSAAIDCCLRCKDYHQADEIFTHVLRVFGSHPKTLLRRAQLYVLLGKSEEAMSMLEEALDKDPSLAEARALWDELNTSP